MSILYQLPADDLIQSLTPIVSVGTADTNYPITNVCNDNLARPVKWTSVAGGFTFYVDLGSAVAIRFCSLHNTRGDAAADYVLLSADDSAFSVNQTQFHFNELGLDDDGYSDDPYIYTGLAGSTARRYWGVAAGPPPLAPTIGRWWLSQTARTLDTPRHDGYTWTEGHEAVIHKTGGGVKLIYPKGIRDPRSVSGTLRTDLTSLGALHTWERKAGCSRAVPIVLDTTRNETRFVRFSPGYIITQTYLSPTLVDVPISWDDVARGLVY